jgi:hypothetical protein
MGGTLGAVVELMLRAMVTRCKSASSYSTVPFTEALEAGVDAVKTYGGAEAGMRTILDAMLPALEALKLGKLQIFAINWVHLCMSFKIIKILEWNLCMCWLRLFIQSLVNIDFGDCWHTFVGATLREVASASEAGAEATGAMTGRAGRSSYVNPDAIAGIPDPGAVAVSVVFKAAAKYDREHQSNEFMHSK